MGTQSEGERVILTNSSHELHGMFADSSVSLPDEEERRDTALVFPANLKGKMYLLSENQTMIKD